MICNEWKQDIYCHNAYAHVAKGQKPKFGTKVGNPSSGKAVKKKGKKSPRGAKCLLCDYYVRDIYQHNRSAHIKMGEEPSYDRDADGDEAQKIEGSRRKEYTFEHGKYKGETLQTVMALDEGYVDWITRVKFWHTR